jgi:hypothetical protein
MSDPSSETRVEVRPLPDSEAAILVGPCSLCGSRRKGEPRSWRLRFTGTTWAEPAEYLVCTRCRRAIRELAEIAFGAKLEGQMDLSADAPY